METRSDREVNSLVGLSPPKCRYPQATRRVAQEVQVARSLLAHAMRSPAALPASGGAALTRFYDPAKLDQQIVWAKGLPADSRDTVIKALRKPLSRVPIGGLQRHPLRMSLRLCRETSRTLKP